MFRRAVLRLVVASSLALAGCAGSVSGPATPTPSPPQISDENATERALAAETAYVSARLENASCLDSWEIGEFTMRAEATVTNRTDRGVIVAVQRPYSWTKDETVADLGSTARYRVTETDSTRLSGSSLNPC